MKLILIGLALLHFASGKPNNRPPPLPRYARSLKPTDPDYHPYRVGPDPRKMSSSSRRGFISEEDVYEYYERAMAIAAEVARQLKEGVMEEVEEQAENLKNTMGEFMDDVEEMVGSDEKKYARKVVAPFDWGSMRHQFPKPCRPTGYGGIPSSSPWLDGGVRWKRENFVKPYDPMDDYYRDC